MTDKNSIIDYISNLNPVVKNFALDVMWELGMTVKRCEYHHKINDWIVSIKTPEQLSDYTLNLTVEYTEDLAEQEQFAVWLIKQQEKVLTKLEEVLKEDGVRPKSKRTRKVKNESIK